jgi:dynactin-4
MTAPPLVPYTYIQCPCSDASILSHPTAVVTSPKSAGPGPEKYEGDDDRTFDPRAPRSNFSLYPLEYLLYCEDCHQIRCPRCVAEEIVTYYCPNCVFEVPSSHIKNEGNR